MVKPTRRLLSKKMQDFPGGIVGKNSPANAGDMGLTPVQEESTCFRATKPALCNYESMC